MARKTNWDKVQGQAIEDSARYRDVYGNQQLDRSHLDEKQTMTSRTILAVVAGLAVAIIIWALVAQVERTGVADGINAGWYNLFYRHDGEKSDYQYLTLRTKVPKFEEDGVTPVLDEDGNQVVDLVHTKYVWVMKTGVVIDITHRTTPEYTGCGPASYDENNNLVYDETATLPMPEEGTPVPRVYGYVNTEGFENKENRFEGREGYLGRTRNDGYVFYDSVLETYFDYDGEAGTGDEVPLEGDWQDPVYLSQFGFQLNGNPSLWLRLNRGKPVDTSDSLMHDRFADYRPTPLKLILALIGFMATFGGLYAVLRKNLDVINSMSDTSDINQHYDDQRLALPEEVQTMYDIFPDVGAHSSVMVSSMISHQMMTSKGVKKVKLAKRADKDILDEDGDVEVYKGDILRDENGEPITTEVTMFDPEFSEALFDSSKTPKNTKDMKYRKYYEAGKIKYNPGNTNLDKLKGYDTVADLINKDWTFPIYEPQRPGGVYIVDKMLQSAVTRRVETGVVHAESVA